MSLPNNDEYYGQEVRPPKQLGESDTVAPPERAARVSLKLPARMFKSSLADPLETCKHLSGEATVSLYRN